MMSDPLRVRFRRMISGEVAVEIALADQFQVSVSQRLTGPVSRFLLVPTANDRLRPLAPCEVSGPPIPSLTFGATSGTRENWFC